MELNDKQKVVFEALKTIMSAEAHGQGIERLEVSGIEDSDLVSIVGETGGGVFLSNHYQVIITVHGRIIGFYRHGVLSKWISASSFSYAHKIFWQRFDRAKFSQYLDRQEAAGKGATA